MLVGVGVVPPDFSVPTAVRALLVGEEVVTARSEAMIARRMCMIVKRCMFEVVWSKLMVIYVQAGCFENVCP